MKSPEVQKGKQNPPWRYTTFKERPEQKQQQPNLSSLQVTGHASEGWHHRRELPAGRRAVCSHCSSHLLAAPAPSVPWPWCSLGPASHHQRVFLRHLAWSVCVNLSPLFWGSSVPIPPCPALDGAARQLQAVVWDPAVGCPVLHPLAAAGTAGEGKAVSGIWL